MGNIKHGMTGTKFYNTWRNIKDRCNNKNRLNYKHYGERGIKILWNSFSEFKKDMYESYLKHIEKFGEKNTTIDRIDSNGNYCKENCRWATTREQTRNTKRNRLITYKGKTKLFSDWAREFNIPIGTLWDRLYKFNWLVEKAFTTPIRRKKV